MSAYARVRVKRNSDLESEHNPFVDDTIEEVSFEREPKRTSSHRFAGIRVTASPCQIGRGISDLASSQQQARNGLAIQRKTTFDGIGAEPQSPDQSDNDSPSQANGIHPGADGGLFDAIPPGSGEALEPTVQAPLEAYFGADLSAIRIHTGPPAARLAAEMNSLAFTAGRDICFA